MYSVPTPRCFYDLKQMLNLKKILTHFQFNLYVYMVLTHSHYAPIEEMYSTYIKGKGEYLQKITRNMFCTHVRQLHCILTNIDETEKNNH